MIDVLIRAVALEHRVFESSRYYLERHLSVVLQDVVLLGPCGKRNLLDCWADLREVFVRHINQGLRMAFVDPVSTRFCSEDYHLTFGNHLGVSLGDRADVEERETIEYVGDGSW